MRTARIVRTLLTITTVTATLLVVGALPVADAGIQDPPFPQLGGGSSRPQQKAQRQSTERDDAKLFRFHNDARARQGLPSLKTDSSLTSFAQRRAAEMARKEQVWHSRNLPAGERWYIVGENVGCAETIEEIFDGFMGSRSHRANVVRSGFRAIGIGVATNAGAKYIAVVYGQPWPAAPALGDAAVFGSAADPSAPGAPAAGISRPAQSESQSVTVLVRLVALER